MTDEMAQMIGVVFVLWVWVIGLWALGVVFRRRMKVAQRERQEARARFREYSGYWATQHHGDSYWMRRRKRLGELPWLKRK